MITEQNKDDFLEMLYRLVGGQLNKNVFVGDLELQLGWDRDIFFDTCEALVEDNLIRQYRTFFGLTPQGQRRVEGALQPATGITHNTITAGTITLVNSSIQQGGAGAVMTQMVGYTKQDSDDLRQLVDVFEKHLSDLCLDAMSERKAKAQVATIKAQLADDDPNPAIVKQAGRTLRNITEGIIASLIATAIHPVWASIPPLMTRLFG